MNSMDEAEIADERKLFGTNGIRGVVGSGMDVRLALEIGMAIGTVIRGRIVIGTDQRSSSQMLKEAVVAGLMATGNDVTDIGLAPTPSVQYAVAKSDASGGVMITASHNPPEFNGIKVIDSDGTELHFSKEVEIERIYFDKAQKTAQWYEAGHLTTDSEANARYIEGIKGLLDCQAIAKSGLRVVVDCANGAGSVVTPNLLSDLGVNVVTLNANPHGSFPGHPSEPTPENLAALMKMVTSIGADFGIAHDGDADRTIFVDDHGGYIMGDRSFALLAGYAVSKAPGSTVVSTVATSDVVSDVVTRNGGKVVQTMVGSPVVARKMKEIGAVFGGEENGGLILAEHQYCRDGAMTAGLMVEMVAAKGPLSSLLDDVPTYHQVKLKTACPNESKKKVTERLVELLSGNRLDLTDGVKVYDGDDWVLIRQSGTEPIFRVFSQARTKERADSLARKYMGTLKDIIIS